MSALAILTAQVSLRRRAELVSLHQGCSIAGSANVAPCHRRGYQPTKGGLSIFHNSLKNLFYMMLRNLHLGLVSATPAQADNDEAVAKEITPIRAFSLSKLSK